MTVQSKQSLIFQICLPGRQFYGCALPQGSGCKFFLWVDLADQGRGGGTGGFDNSFTGAVSGTNPGNSNFSSQSDR